MKITILNNRQIHIGQVTPDVDNMIYDHFSARVKDAQYIDSVAEQSWDGVYRKYRYNKLSKGYLTELLLFCRKHDIPVEINDNRKPPKYPMFEEKDVKPDILKGITLMDHQVKGIKACTKKSANGFLYNEIGTQYFITGSGKTELMCAIAKLLKCPTVIIAEEKVVVDQIKERLELRDVTNEVGLFYAGQSPDGNLVCVGSLASLMAPKRIKRKKDEPNDKYQSKLKAFKTRMENHKKYRKMLAKCELLMIDEVDKAATNAMYKKVVMNYTNSRYIYGFTGTLPMPEDELDNLNLKELVGSIIAKSERRYLESIGRIIPVKYIMLAYGQDKRKDKTAFDIAVKEIIEENDDLHNKIKEIIDKFKGDNFLILVENITAGKNLEEKIENSKFIYGGTTKKERDKSIKAFENGELKVLIGSKILKRGLDVKGGIENLMLCASSKKDSELEQKVGRAVRLNSRGFARVFDFMFLNNHFLYRHSRKRLKRMIHLGYPSKVLFKDCCLDGKRVLKRGFRISKYI